MNIAPIVTWYRSLGWATIRVQPMGKAPVGAWQDRTDEADVFVSGDNVGVRLGAPSGGLVDVDLDCPEAVALAPRFLPATATFGREGARRHWLYICPGVVTRKPPRTHVELRSTGSQTVFPGSMHASGHPIEWLGPVFPPVVVSESELLPAFGRLCFATLVARAWPGLDGNRHDAVLALAGALWHAGWTVEAAMDLLLPPMELDGSREPHRSDAIRDTWEEDSRNRWGWPSVRKLFGDGDGQALERAIELVASVPRSTGEVAVAVGEIDVGGELVAVLDAMGDALRSASGPPRLFRQGGALVTVDGAATAERVAVEVARVAKFVRQGKTARAVVHPPADVVKRFCACPPSGLPELLGRRATPVVRPDGSVWDEAGWDPVTRVWCDGWTDPRVEALDQAQAQAAAGRLLAFVSAGQWVGGEDAIAWLAHVLTVVGRPAIAGPVPAWIYTAAVPGSGKTALARVAGVVGGGCSAYTQPDVTDEDELARRLDTFATAPAVVLDNMRGIFRSMLLEGAVTGGTLAVRRLYVGPVSVPWRAVLAVTSNGAEIGEDWSRRSLPVRLSGRKLDARRDIIEDAGQRPDLVADAAGIVSGFLSSGAAVETTPLLGFAQWSRIIGGCVAWLGFGDVVGMTRGAAADMVAATESGTELLDRVERWLAGRGATEFSAKELWDAPSFIDLRESFRDLADFSRRLSRCGDSSRVLSFRKRHGGVRVYAVSPR